MPSDVYKLTPQEIEDVIDALEMAKAEIQDKTEGQADDAAFVARLTALIGRFKNGATAD